MSHPENLRAKFLELTNPAYEEFIESTKHPHQFREAIWKRLFEEIKNGPFWKDRMDFSGGGLVPLNRFDIIEFKDIEPWLKPESANRLSPLTQKPIIWWAQTAGTTSVNKKMFPFTQDVYVTRVLRSTAGLHANINFRHLRDCSTFKVLYLSGFGPNYLPSNHLPFGHVSTFIRSFSSSDEFAAIPTPVYRDLATFRKWGPVYALNSDVTIFGAVTASPMLSFMIDLQNNHERYLDLLKEGGEEKEGLPKIDRSCERIEYLRQYFRQTRETKFKEIWPNFQMISCWKSGSSSVLLERLSPYLSADIKVVHGAYHATEGNIVFPSLDNEAAGPVDTVNGIVEFIEVGQPIVSSNLIPSWELQVNRKYEVFITNSMGLVRYRMHDIVTCVNHIGSVPVVQFFQKEGATINLVHTQIEEVDILDALRRIDLSLKGKWIFGPGKDFRSIELIHDGQNSAIDDILEAFDKSLRSFHSNYDGALKRDWMVPIRQRFIESKHDFWNRFYDPSNVQPKLPTILGEPFPND